jgi:prophage DNA circulation protein
VIDIELEKQLPVVKMNFAEVKLSIEQAMEKYKGLVVTEDELPGCKATQKQLAGYRNKLDAYRKEVKKEMSKPIADFENDCNVLIKLIEDTEKPIKDGIAVFDQKKRDEKRSLAEETISQAIIEHQLNEKYARQLTVLDKYTILSAKFKDTKADIHQRAFIILQEQIREIEMVRLEAERKAELIALEEKRKLEALEIAKSTLEEANQYIKAKMQIEDFQSLIDSGVSAMRIIGEINKRKERIIISEAPKPVTVSQSTAKPIENSVVIVVEDIKPQEESKIETPVKAETIVEKVYFIEMRVEATLENVTKLSQFLKENKYKYDVSSKGIID